MRKRPILAYAILVIGALASFVCYTRLSNLLPMREADAVTHTQATITEVVTPMIKKDQTGSDVASRVIFRFAASGKEIVGGMSVRDRDHAPAKGDTLSVVYLTARPQVFLPAEEYAQLPHQLTVLRALMIGFALAAMVLPFVVLGTAKS